MGDRRATSGGYRWAAGAWSLAVVLAATAIAFGSSTGPDPASIERTPFGITLLLSTAFLSFATIGALIARRAAGHPVGSLLLGAGLLFEAGLAAENFAKHRASQGRADDWSATASWLDGWAWGLALVLTLMALILFPDRRPTGPRVAVLFWLTAAAGAAQAVAAAFKPGSLGSGSHQTNPLGVGSLDRPLDILATASGVLITLCALATVVGLVGRYLTATGDRRQQLRWLALAAGLTVAGITVAAVAQRAGLELQGLAFVLAVVVIPAAIAVAILRYRLYDIDLVVNRLLVYGLLVAVITGVYVGVTAAAGLIGGDARSAASSVVAAVAVAITVLPARQRLQQLADRIVFGRRATPYQALAGFAEHLAGASSIYDLAPRLAELLADATGAETTTVYVRIDDQLVPCGSSPEAIEPPPVSADACGFDGWHAAALIEHRHDVLGALALNKPTGVPVREADRRVLRQLAAQAAVTFETLRLNAELTRNASVLAVQADELRGSRQRLVEAQDLERRRIGRDLHDGAQQELVAIIAKAMLARGQLRRDPTLADATLQELQADVRNALHEVRELAHGVFPQLLADRGLVPAVAARANRLPLPVVVDADAATDRRFDPALESAAWFVVSESLANVLKHAQALRVTLRLRTTDQLAIEITDDGIGIGTETTGSGLVGMADRVGALGGRLTIGQGPGGGTSVRCMFPLGPDAGGAS